MTRPRGFPRFYPGLDSVEGDLEGLKKDVWGIDDGDEMDKLTSTRASGVGIRKTTNAGAFWEGWSNFVPPLMGRGKEVALDEGVECQIVCL